MRSLKSRGSLDDTGLRSVLHVVLLLVVFSDGSIICDALLQQSVLE